MEDEIIIRPKDIISFGVQGSKFVISAKAEDSLIKLMETKAMLEEQLNAVKDAIVEAGLAIDPDWSGVIGSRVNASYRPFGVRYMITDPDKAKGFYTTKTQLTADVKKIDAYIKKNRSLPEGVTENVRKKSLTLSLSSNLLED